jgi:hypothetical protein
MTEGSLKQFPKDPLYVTFMDKLWDWIDLIDKRRNRKSEEEVDVG